MNRYSLVAILNAMAQAENETGERPSYAWLRSFLGFLVPNIFAPGED